LRRATARLGSFVGTGATTAPGEALKNQRRKRSTRADNLEASTDFMTPP